MLHPLYADQAEGCQKREKFLRPRGLGTPASLTRVCFHLQPTRMARLSFGLIVTTAFCVVDARPFADVLQPSGGEGGGSNGNTKDEHLQAGSKGVATHGLRSSVDAGDGPPSPPWEETLCDQPPTWCRAPTQLSKAKLCNNVPGHWCSDEDGSTGFQPCGSSQPPGSNWPHGTCLPPGDVPCPGQPGINAKSSACKPDLGPVRTVAIAYHGEYDRADVRYGSGGSNYFAAHTNHRERIIEPLNRIPGVNVRTYFHTRRAQRNGIPCPSRDDALVQALKPDRYTFVDNMGPLIVGSYLAVMDLVHQDHQSGSAIHGGAMGDQDVVMLIRFDVVYRYSMTELPSPYRISWTKVNIGFKDDQRNFATFKKVSDLVLIFPLLHYNPMYNALQQSGNSISNGAGHFVYQKLLNLGLTDVNFIDPYLLTGSNVGCNKTSLPREADVGGVPGCVATFLGIMREQPPETCTARPSGLRAAMLPPAHAEAESNRTSPTDPWPFCACWD